MPNPQPCAPLDAKGNDDMKTQIFSSGGGTQSAAITALIVQGRLPKPDFVCIVDTERERGTTWEYLDTVIRPALKSVGLEVHRIRKSEWGSKPPHGKDWRSHNDNTLLLPAWTTQVADTVGKLPGYCSKTWKVETLDRYMNQVFGIKAKDACHWIGFSLDEAKRAVRMMAGLKFQSGSIRLPLIHDVPSTRVQAIAIVKAMGWPPPPRSACWMCPNQDDTEWTSLTPEEFALAVEMDYKIREDDPFAFLHLSGVPLDKVDFGTERKEAGDYCSSVGCFT
jgi:hypothetical protein